MRNIQLKKDSIVDTIRSVIDSKVQYLNLRLKSSIDFYQKYEEIQSEHGQRIISQTFPFDMYERTTHEINLLLTMRSIVDRENSIIINSLLDKSQYMRFENREELKSFVKDYQIDWQMDFD